jgi:hypothetical protein
MQFFVDMLVREFLWMRLMPSMIRQTTGGEAVDLTLSHI